MAQSFYAQQLSGEGSRLHQRTRAISAPPPRVSAALGSRSGTDDEDCEKARIVELIRRLQRSDQDLKQAWFNFSDRELDGVHDPGQHSVAVLREFLACWLPHELAEVRRPYSHVNATAASFDTNGSADHIRSGDASRAVVDEKTPTASAWTASDDASTTGVGRCGTTAGVADIADAAAGGCDVWAEFKLRAHERAGVPLPVPVRIGPIAAPKKPQLQTGHIPVLLHETLNALLSPGLAGVYVDGTFGRGGHTTEILKRLPPGSHLVAFDVDPTAIIVG
eukprot:TRINITY_DN60882_c0_g1_i1.p1 TRINITY_DN60882_c0_g1~~TRINITY_DN60882_c0_g1_i1.p1  ORF type:complete len:302 (-),score=41.17 TRINITY_DN60882_c0_g1_i1:47-880(-)